MLPLADGHPQRRFPISRSGICRSTTTAPWHEITDAGVGMTEPHESVTNHTALSDPGLVAHYRSVAAVAEATYTSRQLHSMLEFHDDRYWWRRLFAVLLGTFMLVFVAAGGAIVNAKFGGSAIRPFILVTAAGMMVLSIILFMGAVSGAHLNRSCERHSGYSFGGTGGGLGSR